MEKAAQLRAEADDWENIIAERADDLIDEFLHSPDLQRLAPVSSRVVRRGVRSGANRIGTLFCQPGSICPDVNHWNRGTSLQPGDQFKKESSGSFCQRRGDMASLRIAHENSMRRDAPQIEPSSLFLAGKRIE
jgi:hypothetical protein